MITIQKNHSAAFIYNGHVIRLELRVIAAYERAFEMFVSYSDTTQIR